MIQELLGGGGETPKPACADASTNSPENLRCPRCDSANTKFCYYNNYNLTQPRHFCKTCRRYWTKGGALRKVPIGGGCRKNKTAPLGKSTAAGKFKTAPIIWPSSQNSHFLSLLRPNQNPTHMFGFNSESSAQALGLDPSGPAHLPYGIQGQNHGLQELYQRLRSTTCYPEHAPLILESAPVAAAAELGFWNTTLSWPTDMPTINGVHP